MNIFSVAMKKEREELMDNYIYIDGEKIELNDSQISALRAALEKKNEESEKASPFERQIYGDDYYCISSIGETNNFAELNSECDSVRHDNANYCADEELLKQRALEEILARRLWRYSMEHGGDKIDWSKSQTKYAIYYDYETGTFYITNNMICQTVNSVYFVDNKTALNAIKDVVNPFMEEYPGFKGYRT